MIFETGQISAAFVFAGMAIFAVCIIALVIWMAVLSSRQRKLSDWMMEQSEMLNNHVERPIDIRVVQAAPTPAYAYDELGMTGAQAQAGQQYVGQPTGEFQAVQPQAQMAQPQPNALQSQASSYNSAMNSAVAKQPTESFPAVQANQYDQYEGYDEYEDYSEYDEYDYEDYDEQEGYAQAQRDFFDGYKSSVTQQPTRSFGRATPTIPFGMDKDAAEKRESYMEDAISADFEPDSIDFSRVAGYRRKN